TTSTKAKMPFTCRIWICAAKSQHHPGGGSDAISNRSRTSAQCWLSKTAAQCASLKLSNVADCAKLSAWNHANASSQCRITTWQPRLAQVKHFAGSHRAKFGPG